MPCIERVGVGPMLMSLTLVLLMDYMQTSSAFEGFTSAVQALYRHQQLNRGIDNSAIRRIRENGHVGAAIKTVMLKLAAKGQV